MTAERNRHVPFPREMISQPAGDLEKLLLSFPFKGEISYFELPIELTSVGIECYANWLQSLTAKDPLHQERGAVCYLRKEIPSQGIIYPVNPNIGEQSVSLVFSIKSGTYIPVIITHSHPNNWSFSGMQEGLADDSKLWSLSVLRAKNGAIVPIPPAHLVSTTENNYLVIRTKETPVHKTTIVGIIDRDALALYKSRYYHFLNQIVLAKNIPLPQFNEIFKKAEQDFNSSFFVFWSCLWYSLEETEKLKMGFYYSKKDGHYIRITKGILETLVRERLEFALDKAAGKS